MPCRVGAVAHVRQAGVDRLPCVVVDEVDDDVGEQGVGQADPVGVLTHECRARLEHVRGAGGGEEVAGEWPAVQGDDGELLDRSRRAAP